MRGGTIVLLVLLHMANAVDDEYDDYDNTDTLENDEASVEPLQKYVAPRSSESRRGKSIDAEAMVDKLAEAVQRSDTEPMVEALSKMLGDPEMTNNPRKLKSEIVKLLRDPKFRKASEGRRTVKAIKLPPGIVKLLNSKILFNTVHSKV